MRYIIFLSSLLLVCISCTPTPEPEPPTCNTNEHLDVNNDCVCDAGYVKADTGICVPETIDCRINEHLENDVCVCNEGYTKNPDGICMLIEEEEPEVLPSDYITKARAGTCSTDPNSRENTGLCRDLFLEIQENASRGWRDWEHVAIQCSWATAPFPGTTGLIFPFTAEELLAFASEGGSLDAEGWRFMDRLGTVNCRCPDYTGSRNCQLKDPAYCGRTEVRSGSLSNSDGTGYRDKLQTHLAEASKLRAYLNGQPGEGVRWDSAKGWCNYANKQR